MIILNFHHVFEFVRPTVSVRFVVFDLISFFILLNQHTLLPSHLRLIFKYTSFISSSASSSYLRTCKDFRGYEHTPRSRLAPVLGTFHLHPKISNISWTRLASSHSLTRPHSLTIHRNKSYNYLPPYKHPSTPIAPSLYSPSLSFVQIRIVFEEIW